MTEKNQPEKKKKTFLLKKRIEDAQNYTKSKTDGRGKTLIPADSKLHLKSFVSKVQYQLKTENEESTVMLYETTSEFVLFFVVSRSSIFNLHLFNINMC